MRWWHRWRYRVWLFEYYTLRGRLDSVKEDGRWDWMRDSYANQMLIAEQLAEFHFKESGLAAVREGSPSNNTHRSDG